MSSRSDAWRDIPNLSGATAQDSERSRIGDPSRFFPSVGSGQVDPLTGRVLKVPRVSVFVNSGGVVANSTVQLVPWDSEEYDSEGMWYLTAPGRLTARTPGQYRVGAWWTWAVNPTGQRGMLIRRTRAGTGIQTSYPGAGVLGEGGDVTAVGAGLRTYQSMEFDIELEAGDYVECFVTQFSGAPLAWVAATVTDRPNGFQAVLTSTFGSDAQ